MIKPMKKFYLILMALAAFTANAQVRIATDQGAAHSKSMLEINSTDKGLLIPRLTTAQRTAITATADATADGLMVYDTDLKTLYLYSGSLWNAIPNTGSISATSTIEPVISSVANSILGFKIGQMNATNGQVLTWSSANSRWEPTTPAAGGGGGGASGNVLITGTNNGGAGNSIAITTPGSTSLSAITDASVATGNVAIGENALAGVTTGQENIAIGIGSADGLITGSRNIFIGAGTQVGDGATNDAIVIGKGIKVKVDPDAYSGAGAVSAVIGFDATLPSIAAQSINNRELIVAGEIQSKGSYTEAIMSSEVGTANATGKRFGFATLANGTATVTISLSPGVPALSANATVYLTSNSATVTGALRGVINGSTLTITSNVAGENGRVAYMIIN